MVIHYLNRLESLDFSSLKRQERADIIMTLSYLEKRVNTPELTQEIKNHILKLKPQESFSKANKTWI